MWRVRLAIYWGERYRVNNSVWTKLVEFALVRVFWQVIFKGGCVIC
jgi:hypothetical protein